MERGVGGCGAPGCGPCQVRSVSGDRILSAFAGFSFLRLQTTDPFPGRGAGAGGGAASRSRGQESREPRIRGAELPSRLLGRAPPASGGRCRSRSSHRRPAAGPFCSAHPPRKLLLHPSPAFGVLALSSPLLHPPSPSSLGRL